MIDGQSFFFLPCYKAQNFLNAVHRFSKDMFLVIRLIIWLAGVTVIAYFILPYFGYAINTNYWSERKSVCQENLNQCRKDLIKGGLDGAREHCDFQCVDPKLFIKKQ